MRGTDGDNALLAVVAHGLLNAVYPALMAAEALQRDDVPDALRAELLSLVAERTTIVVETLHDLVRGIPPAVLEVLENLSVEDLQPAEEPTPEGDAGQRRAIRR